MPGYGIQGPTEGTGLLPWSWAVERLTSSHDYWVATVDLDGKPAVMPVWGAWIDDALWFSSSPGSRRARNLGRDPRCTVTTDNPLEPVALEGTAQRIADRAAFEAFTAVINPKYDANIPVAFFADNALFRVPPTVAYGLTEADFTGTPTKWSFSTR
jgi:nitroimidazol reductase NimA-like FMN-containing flavoprotein (pyridoxamine 5'-phosphate oxidase superfamily)